MASETVPLPHSRVKGEIRCKIYFVQKHDGELVSLPGSKTTLACCIRNFRYFYRKMYRKVIEKAFIGKFILHRISPLRIKFKEKRRKEGEQGAGEETA